ncbi:probable G-protein coupled receptor 34 [Melanotaenia boesemani]|uniref:probable G-protein coupled receptor 34 n=1 Tax=Melanotaenia boesemani TaxID=1250792 RepID=UPI001C03C6FB|nr:probable G-protein coupled receptor 34 [Melanotaenia boesemani]
MTTIHSTSSFTPTPSASASFNSSLSISTSSFFSSASVSPFTTSISSTVSPNQECTFDDSALHLLLAVVYSLFFIFGLVGNLFALWVFLFLHSNRNSVRVFLINCAVADLILLACLPFRVFYHVNRDKWVLGSVACKLVGNIFYMNMYISIALLGLISLDRYLRLRGKGRERNGVRLRLRLWGRSRPCSWLVCGALWGVSLTAAAVMIATAEDMESNDKCFQYKKRKNSQGKGYFNAVLVFMFWLVFIMIVVSYAKIASQLLQVSRDKPDLPNANKYKRTAKKSFFVLFLFTVCFGPYHAFRPIYIYSQLNNTISCDYIQLVDHTNEVMLLFSAFNSCLDPVMYFLLSGSVRKTALQVIGNRLGGRFIFHAEPTSFSSTAESRRPDHNLNTPSLTPRTSICVSTLHRIGGTTLRPTVQQ